MIGQFGKSGMGRPLNIAIIGAGYFANHVHFPAIWNLMENPRQDIALRVSGIWDLDSEKARTSAERFCFGQVYSSFDALVGDEDVEAFVVLVPPGDLKDLLERIFPLKKPIFTEKPLGMSHAEAESLAAQVDTLNLVAFNRRFAQLNVRFKEMAESLENLVYISCDMHRYNRFEDHFVVGTGVHVLNFLEYVAGPCSFENALVLPAGNGSAPVYQVQLKFQSGVAGAVRFMQTSGICCERYEAHSTEQSIYLYSGVENSEDYPGIIYVYEHGSLRETIEGNSRTDRISVLGILAEYEEFIRSCLHGCSIRSTFATSVNCMKVAEEIENKKT